MARNLTVLALLMLLQACSAPKPKPFMLGEFLSAKELPYDSPSQVIYRIDDHRFVTLERYLDCHHGETFYNDTTANIRRKIGIGRIENFQGRLINADPTGMNIVLPLSYPPRISCGDRGCTVPLRYSTDGGVTFHLLTYMEHSPRPFENSKIYTIAATNDSLYISHKISETADSYSTDRYPLIPGFVYEAGEKLPDGKEIEFNAKMPPDLKTLSGQDRITCDATLKPNNPDAPLVP
jgi:hypothetical protein